MNRINNEIQLDEYFRSHRHSKVSLDKKITPLLKYIKKNKVNSIHQMDNKFCQDEFINLYNPKGGEKTVILPKQNIFFSNATKGKKQMGKTLQAIIAIKNNISATAPLISRGLDSYKPRATTSNGLSKRLNLSISPSKVKKHLIESNNSEIISMHWPQSSKHINLFQHFCQSIQQKQQKHLFQKGIKQQMLKRRTNNCRLINNQQAQRKYKIRQAESQGLNNNFLKGNHNKKFWNKDLFLKKKSFRQSKQLLSLRGECQMPNFVSL